MPTLVIVKLFISFLLEVGADVDVWLEVRGVNKLGRKRTAKAYWRALDSKSSSGRSLN